LRIGSAGKPASLLLVGRLARRTPTRNGRIRRHRMGSESEDHYTLKLYLTGMTPRSLAEVA
jgi:hypothetical protein